MKERVRLSSRSALKIGGATAVVRRNRLDYSSTCIVTTTKLYSQGGIHGTPNGRLERPRRVAEALKSLVLGVTVRVVGVWQRGGVGGACVFCCAC